MLVEKRMRKNPETITPEDYLAGALAKMHKGGFRRLPVVTPYLDPALETGQIMKDGNRFLNFLRDGPYMVDGEAIKLSPSS